MTKIITVKEDFSVLDEAAEGLKQGKLVAFPTETVYGLGANGLNAEAIPKIFAAKGRPQDNPLIVHISNRSMLSSVVKTVPAQAELLMDTFWPGPLTIILEKNDAIPLCVSAGLSTVGVRMPSHPVARYLIEKSGVPVAAPSANLSGSPSTTKGTHVIKDLSGRVDYIIDGGACAVGLESTVLDMTGDVPQILRPGGVGIDALEMVLGKVIYDPALSDSSQVPKSPGMKYRHYAPKASLYLVEEGTEELLKTTLTTCSEKSLKTGVICRDAAYGADVCIPCGKKAEDYAKNLFDALRKMDAEEVSVIFAELPSDSGGIVPALKNRLLKAAGGHILSSKTVIE